MPRSWFGGTGNELPIVIGSKSELQLRATWPLKVFDAEVGGNQHTGLLLNGVSVDQIPPGPVWYPRFQGPDGVNNHVWGEINGGQRFLMPARNPPVVVVPAGTTGYATQPDNTLWVEYIP